MNEVAGNEPNAGATAGGQLSRARSARGLSIADVARQLKLSPAQVEALEAGQYDRLPGRVFVRGFMRNYARLVKLDPEPLLASVEPGLTVAPETRQTTVPPAEIPFPTGRESKWHRYVIVFAVLATPVLIYEFSRDEVPQVTVKPRQLAPEVQVASDAKPEAEAPASSAPATPDVSATTGSAGSDRATDKPVERTAAKSKRGERIVRLKFDKESWVEIRDREGHRILYQLNPAGSEREVAGSPPLSLIVGNASGVRVTVNDQPVDLAPHTRLDDLARLTLE